MTDILQGAKQLTVLTERGITYTEINGRLYRVLQHRLKYDGWDVALLPMFSIHDELIKDRRLTRNNRIVYQQKYSER